MPTTLLLAHPDLKAASLHIHLRLGMAEPGSRAPFFTRIRSPMPRAVVPDARRGRVVSLMRPVPLRGRTRRAARSEAAVRATRGAMSHGACALAGDDHQPLAPRPRAHQRARPLAAPVLAVRERDVLRPPAVALDAHRGPSAATGRGTSSSGQFFRRASNSTCATHGTRTHTRTHARPTAAHWHAFVARPSGLQPIFVLECE